MKKDKKNLGFTMIEMLATILVLLIVLLIATPSIRRMLNKTNDLSKEYVENLVIDAAKEYASVTNKTVTDTLKLVGDKNVIFLETLLNMGLIEQTDIDKLGTEARVLLTLKDNNYLEYKIVYDGSLAENTNGQIILLGGNPTYVRQNTPYMEPGYIALDSLGNIVNGEVEITGEVNTAILGVYEKTYKYTDEKNNVIEVKRTVIVYDSTYPKVTVATTISNNPYNNKFAKNGERITLNITFSKVVTDPKVTIGGRTATVTGTSTVKKATLTIPSDESTLANGPLNINISNYKDIYDNVGDTVTNVTSGNLVVFDNIAPVIAEKYAGSMLYADSTFAFGTNGFGVYNNSGNGTVTHARVALDNPYGSYVMRIKTAGTASPGLGGYVQSVNSRANAIYIHKIIAKIPVGYTINFASNAVGDAPSRYWITPQAGTGAWKEYAFILKTSATGTFSSFGYIYLSGPGTSVTWDVAYSTIIDTARKGTTASITFRATDAGSGFTHYGINQSATTQPAYTAVTNSSSLGVEKAGYTANGTYYVWVKDAVGNVTNRSIAVSSIDTTAPTCSVAKSNTGTTAGVTATVTGTDAESGIVSGTGTFTGLKANKTYTVTNGVGLTGTCSVTVSSRTEYASGSCTACTGYTRVVNNVCSTCCTESGTPNVSPSYVKCTGITRYRYQCDWSCSGNVHGIVYSNYVYTSCANAKSACTSLASCPSGTTKIMRTNTCGSEAQKQRDTYTGGTCSAWGAYGAWTTTVCTAVDNVTRCQTRTVYN